MDYSLNRDPDQHQVSGIVEACTGGVRSHLALDDPRTEHHECHQMRNALYVVDDLDVLRTTFSHPRAL